MPANDPTKRIANWDIGYNTARIKEVLDLKLYCFTPNGTKRASDLWSLLPVLSLRLARRETCC